MRILSKITLLVAVLALAACNNGFGNSDRFGNGAGGVGGAGGAGDPRSPAYFSETIGDRVLFAVDQNTLSDEARVILQGQANWLMQNTEYSAIIEGHADEQGTREYNMSLGARRASAVRDFLVDRGVADSRLRTVTYGKERPLEVCSEETCYAKNRRAVTVISAGLSG